MQDDHRLKDRIDLSLDNRQVFLLFVASAVVVTLVFALGVVVGKRMAPSAAAKAPTDPLALLDQLGKQSQDDDLSFPQKLGAPRPGTGSAAAAGSGSGTGSAPGSAQPQDNKADDDVLDRAAKALAAARKAADEAKAREEAKTKAAAAKAAVKAAAKAAKLAAAAKAKKTAKAKAAAKKAAKAARIAKARAAAAAKRAAKAVKTAAKKRAAAIAAKRKAAKQAKSKKAAKTGSYTLQLSSFQDRAEAEQYMTKLRGQGLAPHMIPARIPGRGVWYRVRLGSYKSWEDAVAAKKKYETTQQLIAYVARN